MNKTKWFLNGGRGSGRTIRLLCEAYENKIAELEEKNIELLGKLAFTENALNNAKAQIEKFKICGNCKSYNMNYLPYYCNKKNEPKHCFEKCDKWELKEK